MANTIKQISIFVENKPGRLADITDVIAGAGVDIRALSIADTTDYGILRLIVNKPVEAVTSLKEAGITASITEVLAIRVADTPGGFAKAIRVLADGGMSVEYAYAFITPEDGDALVIIRVNDNDKAEEILVQNGVILATEKDIDNL